MAEKVEYTSKPKEGKAWDVAIIGSGPAALTAAIYTTRGAASTIILGGEVWGGQLMLTTQVDNFPGLPGIHGPELMQKVRDHALRFGAEFIEKNVTEVDFNKKPYELKAGDTIYKAKSVIIATGAKTRWLNIPGEEGLRGRGVSSCAPCDAPFFKDKKVAVVGGGDSAMEEALVLTKYASQVTVIHRRDELKASAAMQKKFFKKVEEGKAGVIWDTEVVEVLGDQSLEKAKLKTKIDSEQGSKLKSGELKDIGSKVVEEKDGFVFWELPLDGLFVAIGHIPSSEMFKNKVDTDEKGYVVTHDRTKTSLDDGIFVAGDVHDHQYRQAITAAAFGCMAGMDVLKYLDGLETKEIKDS